ncbi:MAG: hypothetical protein M3P27_09770 [Acidobacteriota bacterium]|nr:hypothetical protein [Acidobacteriota bacterium]
MLKHVSPTAQPTWQVPKDELRMYRAHAIGLLRRYFRMSLELGRLPSLVGREIFRARVSSYRAASFEDLVIFVTDVERCVERLDEKSQLAIARVIFQEYSVEEAGRMLGCTERSVRTHLAGGLDRLAHIFLLRGLLHPFALHEIACQEPKKQLFSATH